MLPTNSIQVAPHDSYHNGPVEVWNGAEYFDRNGVVQIKHDFHIDGTLVVLGDVHVTGTARLNGNTTFWHDPEVGDGGSVDHGDVTGNVLGRFTLYSSASCPEILTSSSSRPAGP